MMLFAGMMCTCYASPDPTTLSPGDIAITGYNFTNPDEFSFVTFVNLSAGTVIYFTDCGWKSDNTFRKGEGLITYTVPAGGIEKGITITYPTDAGFTVQGVDGFFGFSTSGDQIIAFQGSMDMPVFIFALNNEGSSWQTTAGDNNSSALPNGLTDGENAVAIDETRNASYNCVYSGSNKNLALQNIVNPDNWSGSNTSTVVLPPSCFQTPLPLQAFELEEYFDKSILKFKIKFINLECVDLTIDYSENAEIFINENEYKCVASEFNYAPVRRMGYYKITASSHGEEIHSEIVFLGEGSKLVSVDVYDFKGSLVGHFDQAEFRLPDQGGIFLIVKVFSDHIERELVEK